MQIHRVILTLTVTALCQMVWLSVKVAVSAAPPLLLSQAASRSSQADQLLEQGTQQYRTGQPTAAIDTHQQALALTRQLNDKPGEGTILANLGVAYEGNFGSERSQSDLDF